MLGTGVEPELNLCQIEVGTPVCTTLAQVRSELTRLRSGLRAAAAEAGCDVAAVGTHPYGMWQDQRVDVSRGRYRQIEDVYQIGAASRSSAAATSMWAFPTASSQWRP